MKKQPEDDFIDILTQSYTHIAGVKNNSSRTELDLGCGSGSFTAGLAGRYPEAKIFAADVMIGRLRKLVRKNQRLGIDNMQLLRVEARHLVAYMLPDEGLDRLHILCPDPWPKDRHKGHRLVTSDFLSQIHRVLKKAELFTFQAMMTRILIP
ncbi:MAG: methyltransferase domain-containing protein [Lentisphaeria bacterium]|nr:methyltransferase domain-containing protein [Lentisphaeria bacterium]